MNEWPKGSFIVHLTATIFVLVLCQLAQNQYKVFAAMLTKKTALGEKTIGPLPALLLSCYQGDLSLRCNYYKRKKNDWPSVHMGSGERKIRRAMLV